MTDTLENRTFAEMCVGESVGLTRTLTANDIVTWAAVTGNINPAHLDEDFARKGIFREIVGPGQWGVALFTTLVGTRLPGPGSITLSDNMRFLHPLEVDAEVTATLTVTEKNEQRGTVLLSCVCVDESGTELINGTIEVLAPTEKYREAAIRVPTVQLRREDRYQRLLDSCRDLEPISTAVAHPCSPDALVGPVQAAEAGLIDPILIGPEKRIRALAEQAAIDIQPYRLVPTPHSHASAERAVDLVRAGEAETLMKGSLHTDELLHAVLRRDKGLRTERRLSHVFLIAVPTFSRPILVTDAAINIYPKLEDKRDICQNAIDMAHVVGIEEPKVAILSAVETVSPAIPSTIEAAALCKMAERGQITGGLLDGPLAFDNAIDELAARTKGIKSPVAGKADILVVPDLEAGNILAKQLTFMAGADAAGLVLGARVAIILTSRADNVRTRLASCAAAVLYAYAQRQALAAAEAAEE